MRHVGRDFVQNRGFALGVGTGLSGRARGPENVRSLTVGAVSRLSAARPRPASPTTPPKALHAVEISLKMNPAVWADEVRL